jgi:Fe-S-cluster-containing dehydrogenase component
MTSCPVNAIAIAPHTGAKVVIERTCVGCAVCTIACPFGTVFIDPATRKAFKCDLCGGDPVCAKACPTRAIEFVESSGPDWFDGWGARLAAGGVAAPPPAAAAGPGQAVRPGGARS